MKYLLLIIALVASIFSVHGQSLLLTGAAQTKDKKNPIPYVNIGIKGKNIGAAADEHGEFSFRVPSTLIHDTLTFSAIGYQEKNVLISQIPANQRNIFFLEEKKVSLQEVVVRGHAEKIRRIGTTSHNPLLWGSVLTKDTHDIVEFGKLISLAEKPSQLIDAHIFLRRPTTDSVAIRINFYGVDQGMPANRLVEQTIIIRTTVRNGWLNIDLTKYNLSLQHDFYISFEFLPEKNNSVPQFSYGAQLGGAALIRTSSLGTWKRESGASLAAYVTVKQ
ncbi:hypothetical protein GCM10027594_16040 [Hymenobacter agri]